MKIQVDSQNMVCYINNNKNDNHYWFRKCGSISSCKYHFV